MSRKKQKKDNCGIFQGYERYLPLAIFILAFAIRAFFWPAGLFHTDSVITAAEAERSISEGRLYYLQGNLGYPGYAAVTTLIWGLWSLTGAQSSEQILILSSIVFGALSCTIAYYLMKKLTGSIWAGLYSALILCFMPAHLSLSTYVKDQMLGACFMFASLYLARLAAEKKDIKTKLLAVAVMGYTIAIRQQEFLLIPSFLLMYFGSSDILRIKNNKGAYSVSFSGDASSILRDVLILTIPAILIFGVAFIPKMIYEPQFSLVKAFSESGGQQTDGFSLFSPRLTFFSIPWAITTLTYLGVLLLMVSIVLTAMANPLVWASLMLWMVPYFMLLGNFSQVSPYFIFPSFLPAALLMGWGLDEIGKRWGQQLSAIIISVLIVWMLVNITPVLSYRANSCGPCDFSKQIAQLTPANSFIEGTDETRHYEYYAGKGPVRHPRPNPFNTTDLEEYLSFLEGLMDNGSSLYITTMGTGNDYLPEQAYSFDPQSPGTLVNMVTGRRYDNLRYDGRFFIDKQSNIAVPVSGAFTLELFNHFKTTRILEFDNEDWHHKSLELAPYKSSLYKFSRRQ